MPLTEENIEYIKGVIRNNLRSKFLNYVPKANDMPFHTRLLGKDRMALFSFIQSLNTTFGASLFEPVAVSLANTNDQFVFAERQHDPGNKITENAQSVIQGIINNLSIGGIPNKDAEVELIRSVCTEGDETETNTVKVDLFLKTIDEEIYLFDLKTAKPNKSNFKDFKRTLLEWTALELFQNSNAIVNSLIAIPYNPFAPNPYQFWTSTGMLEKEKELKVGKEFWDFLGGKGAYEDLLDCFEQVGIEMRDEIDEYFNRFQ
jgi:hypothetical protein